MKRWIRTDQPIWHRIRRVPQVLSGVLIALVLAPSQLNAASPQPASITGNYSSYEREAITAAEQALGTVTDPSPEGKTVEEVVVISLDPIEQRDPLPVEINVLHSSTKRFIIERELG